MFLRRNSQQEDPGSPFVLFLASFCLHVRDTTVPHVTGLLESAFLSQQASAPGMWFDAALLTRYACSCPVPVAVVHASHVRQGVRGTSVCMRPGSCR